MEVLIFSIILTLFCILILLVSIREYLNLGDNKIGEGFCLTLLSASWVFFNLSNEAYPMLDRIVNSGIWGFLLASGVTVVGYLFLFFCRR